MNITMVSSTYALADLESVPYNNILIINLDSFIDHALKRADDYNYQNTDKYKIFMNYFIIEVCDALKDNLTKETVLFLNTKTPLISDDSLDITLKLIDNSLKALGLSILKAPYSLKVLYNKLLNRDEDSLISLEVTTKSIKKLKSLRGLMKFLKSNGLTFLHDTYFRDPSNKLVLFR